MDPIFFEQVLIKLLFYNKNVQEKVFPFLTDDIFDKLENKNLVKTILGFFKKFEKFPNISELKMEMIHNEELSKYFVEVIETDLSEYDDEFLLKKIEVFFKKKRVFHEITRAVECLKDDNLDSLLSIPENFREAVAFTFDNSVGMSVFTEEGKTRMYNHLHEQHEYIPTGLETLDKEIGGGFHKKTVSILLGQGNIGKTLIACAIASLNIQQNKKVLYITMELNEEYITQRILQNIFDMTKEQMINLTKEQYNLAFDKQIKRIGNLLVVKKYSPGINCSHIRSLIKELDLKQKFVPDIIFVDYLGELDSIKEGNNSNDIGKYKCQELEGIAFDFDIPVVSPAQVNRGGYSTSNLDPTDVADSIGIFTETDLVIGITQTPEQYEANVYTLDIMKNRFGERLRKVNIGVDRSKMKLFKLSDISIMTEQDAKSKLSAMSSIVGAGVKENRKEIKNGLIFK